MKYSRLSRFTRFMSRHRCLSERKTHKTVVPRFRKRPDLSGCIGDTTTSGFFRLFLFSLSRFRFFLVAAILLITTTAFAQVVEIPDPNLRQALRQELQLSDDVSITQQQMLKLIGLFAADRGIIDLTGLEYAINLDFLDLGGNQIHDIRPLENLIQLTWLSLWQNQVQDITPLTNLTKLKTLDLSYNYIIESLEPLKDLIQLEVLNFTNNQVKDITPLANMTKLKYLELRYNQVGDLTPLANLVNLEELYIKDNLANDITPLQGLNLIKLSYDEVCDIPPLPPPVRERIESRSFPSVFQAWDHVQGQDHLTVDQRYALHDLFWNPMPEWGISWDTTPTEPTYGLATALLDDSEYVRQVRQRWLEINPNMVLIGGMNLAYHWEIEAFPPDSDLWLRDNQGQIVLNDVGEYHIDFYKPEVQDLFAKRIIGMAQCGLFDGIMLDSMFREDPELWLNMFRTVRSQVHEDFLIIVNTNRDKLLHYAEYVNGTFMETGKDYPGGYTHEGLKEIESTLIWSEQNFRSPQVNCLEGWGMSIEPPDGPNNLRWMRVFTTMSLTLSDGYMLYTINKDMPDDAHHWHLWYPFWDADLGRPVSDKAIRYQNIEGLFIREFTNGWAIYNRSGSAQTITLPQLATAVGNAGRRSLTHLLPDLDGEIYLKVGIPIDINTDGTVNVLDLILVAQRFGTAAGDVNGDGETNILDLTLVAQQFSQ